MKKFWFEFSRESVGGNPIDFKDNTDTLASIGKLILVFNELERNLLWCIQLLKGEHDVKNDIPPKKSMDPGFSKKREIFRNMLSKHNHYVVPSSNPNTEYNREEYEDALDEQLGIASQNRNKVAHFVESLNRESWEFTGQRPKKTKGLQGASIREYFKKNNPDLIVLSKIDQEDLDASAVHISWMGVELIRLYYALYESTQN